MTEEFLERKTPESAAATVREFRRTCMLRGIGDKNVIIWYSFITLVCFGEKNGRDANLLL